MAKTQTLDEIELGGPVRKIYEVLRDGCRHTRGALQRAAWGAEGEDYASNLQVAISDIRAEVNPLGFDVLIRFDKMKAYYQLIKLTNRAETPEVSSR